MRSERKSAAEQTRGSFAGTPQGKVRTATNLLQCRRGFHPPVSGTKSRPERRRPGGVHPAARRKETEGAPPREESRFQKRAALSSRIEGTSPSYSAVRGMKRHCLAEGSERFENLGSVPPWLANNLMRIAGLLDDLCAKRKSSVTVSSEFSSLSPPVPKCFSFAVAPFHTIQNSRWLTLSERRTA